MKLTRRDLLKVAGTTALGTAGEQAAAASPAPASPAYSFFTPQEARFIEAAVARLIPIDELGPGAIEAGVPAYLDQQLGGAWGAGERLYRSGPWQAGTPSQGYQLPFTPAELFRNALRALDAELHTRKTDFAALEGAQQDAYLKDLQTSDRDLGGACIGEMMTNGRPIEFHPVPPGTPSWGAEWKKAVVRHYNHTSALSIHGSSAAVRGNFLDLDPTYKDAWGLPLLRMTFDFPENDLKMAAYVTAKAVEIGKAMGGQTVVGAPRKGPYTITQYQTTHNTGGTVMGDDRSTSVVNRYLQSWDVPNVFVIGASNFPQNASYNPTDTVGALAYWAADALVKRYLKAPGPLVQA